MKGLFSLLFIISVLKMFGQTTFNFENITVTENDLKTSLYVKDSTANAVVIFEKGESITNKSEYVIEFTFKQKLKILNKKGLNQATIRVPLLNIKNKSESIYNFTAITHNLIDGKIEKSTLNPTDLLKKKIDENRVLVTFILPNVREGSVITYGYTIKTPFLYGFKSWDFQSNIPKIYSEYQTLTYLNFNLYNVRLIGSLELHSKSDDFSEDDKNCLKSTYIMKDIPPFIEEEFISSKENYLSRIVYEPAFLKGNSTYLDYHSPSWGYLDQIFKNKLFDEKSLNKNTKPINLEIAKGIDTLKKAGQIFKFIQENYKLNKASQLMDNLSLKNLIKRKSGNAKELNFLLFSLLKENNINVNPILLSTRSNGLILKKYPVYRTYNYFIVQARINNKVYLLDVSNKYLPFGEIPFECLNQYGRLIDNTNYCRWVDIVVDKISSSLHQLKLTVKENGDVCGEIKSRFTGYHALSKKEDYYTNPGIYIEKLEKDFENLDIIKHNLESKRKNDAFFQESFDVKFAKEDIVNDLIYLNPFVFKFFKENPFKFQERIYPIDFGYKKSYLYNLELNLNNQYLVMDLPENQNIKLPNDAGSFIFMANTLGKKLNVSFKVNLNKPIYSTFEYESLKELMSRVIDVQTNTTIILKKAK